MVQNWEVSDFVSCNKLRGTPPTGMVIRNPNEWRWNAQHNKESYFSSLAFSPLMYAGVIAFCMFGYSINRPEISEGNKSNIQHSDSIEQTEKLNIEQIVDPEREYNAAIND
jgi:hypothetical protein